MPNAWTTWVKDWAKKHNVAYGCALADIDCSAEYRLQKEDKAMEKQHKANIQERKKAQKRITPPSLTQPMSEAFPNTEPISKNIQIMPRQPQPAKAKRGRPQKHATEEAKYAAKLLSNKLKRREKRAAEQEDFPVLNLGSLSKKAPSKPVKGFYAFHSPLIPKKLIIVNK